MVPRGTESKAKTPRLRILSFRLNKQEILVHTHMQLFWGCLEKQFSLNVLTLYWLGKCFLIFMKSTQGTHTCVIEAEKGKDFKISYVVYKS